MEGNEAKNTRKSALTPTPQPVTTADGKQTSPFRRKYRLASCSLIDSPKTVAPSETGGQEDRPTSVQSCARNHRFSAIKRTNSGRHAAPVVDHKPPVSPSMSHKLPIKTPLSHKHLASPCHSCQSHDSAKVKDDSLQQHASLDESGDRHGVKADSGPSATPTPSLNTEVAKGLGRIRKPFDWRIHKPSYHIKATPSLTSSDSSMCQQSANSDGNVSSSTCMPFLAPSTTNLCQNMEESKSTIWNCYRNRPSRKARDEYQNSHNTVNRHDSNLSARSQRARSIDGSKVNTWLMGQRRSKNTSQISVASNSSSQLPTSKIGSYSLSKQICGTSSSTKRTSPAVRMSPIVPSPTTHRRQRSFSSTSRCPTSLSATEDFEEDSVSSTWSRKEDGNDTVTPVLDSPNSVWLDKLAKLQLNNSPNKVQTVEQDTTHNKNVIINEVNSRNASPVAKQSKETTPISCISTKPQKALSRNSASPLSRMTSNSKVVALRQKSISPHVIDYQSWFYGKVRHENQHPLTSMQSENGNRGFLGTQSENGNRGYLGIQSENGNRGFLGTQSENGNRGYLGIQSENGNRGYHGIQSENGNRGYLGIQSENGNRGYHGIQSENGNSGLLGIQSENSNRGYLRSKSPIANTAFQGTENSMSSGGKIRAAVRPIQSLKTNSGHAISANLSSGESYKETKSFLTRENIILPMGTNNLHEFKNGDLDRKAHIVHKKDAQDHSFTGSNIQSNRITTGTYTPICSRSISEIGGPFHLSQRSRLPLPSPRHELQMNRKLKDNNESVESKTREKKVDQATNTEPRPSQTLLEKTDSARFKKKKGPLKKRPSEDRQKARERLGIAVKTLSKNSNTSIRSNTGRKKSSFKIDLKNVTSKVTSRFPKLGGKSTSEKPGPKFRSILSTSKTKKNGKKSGSGGLKRPFVGTKTSTDVVKVSRDNKHAKGSGGDATEDRHHASSASDSHSSSGKLDMGDGGSKESQTTTESPTSKDTRTTKGNPSSKETQLSKESQISNDTQVSKDLCRRPRMKSSLRHRHGIDSDDLSLAEYFKDMRSSPPGMFIYLRLLQFAENKSDFKKLWCSMSLTRNKSSHDKSGDESDTGEGGKEESKRRKRKNPSARDKKGGHDSKEGHQDASSMNQRAVSPKDKSSKKRKNKHRHGRKKHGERGEGYGRSSSPKHKKHKRHELSSPPRVTDSKSSLTNVAVSLHKQRNQPPSGTGSGQGDKGVSVETSRSHQQLSQYKSKAPAKHSLDTRSERDETTHDKRLQKETRAVVPRRKRSRSPNLDKTLATHRKNVYVGKRTEQDLEIISAYHEDVGNMTFSTLLTRETINRGGRNQRMWKTPNLLSDQESNPSNSLITAGIAKTILRSCSPHLTTHRAKSILRGGHIMGMGYRSIGERRVKSQVNRLTLQDSTSTGESWEKTRLTFRYGLLLLVLILQGVLYFILSPTL